MSLEGITDNETESLEQELAVRQRSAEEVNQHEESSTEKASVPLRVSTSIRKGRKWFKMSAMSKTFTSDAPLLKKAMEGEDEKVAENEIETETDILEDMRCWKLVSPLEREKVMVRNLCFRRNGTKKDAVRKHKAYLVVCGNKRIDCLDESFYPIAPY